MAEKKPTESKANLEREYTIPLRHSVNKVPRYKRTNKAVRTIKEFLARHMKVIDRDLNKIKLDRHLNEFVWFRGIKSPPSKVRVKAVKEGDIVRAELLELPGKLKFKKERLERREKKAEESGKKKKILAKSEEAKEEKTEEQKVEEKEKKAAVVETGKAIEKAAAKQIKHEAKKGVQQTRGQQRKALSR